DRKGNHFYMGLNHEGVITYRGSRKAHVFSWQKINKISYEGKLFIIQVEWEQRRHTLGFKCPTPEAAEALWKWAVDRQCFFTLNRSVDAKESKANGGLFKRRQFYTFTGRCQKELMQLNSSMPAIPQPSVARSRSLLNLAKSVHNKRYSQSQNDLDRKYVDSNENIQDGSGMGRLIKGLDHHRSSLETRRNNGGFSELNDNLINKRLTDQLGGGTRHEQSQTLQDQQISPQQHQNKSSLSTPNLANISSINKNDLKTVNDNCGNIAFESLTNQRDTSLSNQKIYTDKPYQDTCDTPENEGKENKTDVDNNERRQNNMKTSQIMKSTHPDTDVCDENSVNSVSSGVEENAEATEQPLQTNVNLNNVCGIGTGSVNTLSSSPLKSADEDDAENDEFIDNEIKPNDNSIMYQKIKVGNWLGESGIKSIKNNINESISIVEEDNNQKVDNNNNDKKMNRLSQQHSNTKHFINMDSKHDLKDDSYSPVSTLSDVNQYVNVSQMNDQDDKQTKLTQSIKPSVNFPIPIQPDEINSIKTMPKKEINSIHRNNINYNENKYLPKYPHDPSASTESPDQNKFDSTMNRSKSLYFNQNKSSTIKDSLNNQMTNKINLLTSTSKSQYSINQHYMTSTNTSKSSIYFPYACHVTSIDALSSLNSITTHKIPLNITSMKHYTESRRNINYPKLPNSELLLLNQHQNNLLTKEDMDKSQSLSRKTGLSTTIKDLSPQPRDWHYMPTNIYEEKDNVNDYTNIGPDISNIILDPIDASPSTYRRQIDYKDNDKDNNKSKYVLSSRRSDQMNTPLTNESITISNDLFFDNGYRPLNKKQMNKTIDNSNVTSIINTNSSYLNISDSMLAQTSYCHDTIFSSNLSSLAKATTSLNLNKNIATCISQGELIDKLQSYNQIQNKPPSVVHFSNQSRSDYYDYRKIKPISNVSLTSSTKLDKINYPTSTYLIDSSSYLNQSVSKKSNVPTSNVNTTTTTKDVNSNINNRTAGSSAAHLAAMGVGAYKLGDSLALLTTRTDQLIESRKNNDNNEDDMRINRENSNSISLSRDHMMNTSNNENNKKESQMKTSNYYSIKQPTSYTPSPKPTSTQSYHHGLNAIYQSKENNNDDSSDKISSRKYYRSGELDTTIPNFEDNAIRSMKRVTDKVEQFMNFDRIDNDMNFNESNKQLPPLALKNNTINNQLNYVNGSSSSFSPSSNQQSFTSEKLNSIEPLSNQRSITSDESTNQLFSCFQQLFYYFIVALIVYKLLTWFNIKPSFG
ncbi:FERM domain-containing protein, partial [Schistosoma japonicum]